MRVLIPLWTGAPIFNRELDGRHNVDDEAGDQERADGPQRRPQAVQKSAVRVDVRPAVREEDLQISGKMPQHVGDKDQPGEGDDPFPAD